MNTIYRYFSRIIIISLLLAGLIACGSAKQDKNGNSDDDSGVDLELLCGVLFGGDVDDNPNSADGEEVRIDEVFSANTLALIPRLEDGSFGGPFLVKLQGVKDTPTAKRSAAISRLSTLGRGTVTFFRANGDCTAPATGGGTAIVGHLVNGDSESLNEEIIRSGLADVEANDACGGGEIGECFAAIADSNLETAGELDAFLWKPISDSNGKLAIHTGPSGTVVIVNGETGSNQGGGNGYGSLARFSQPGCAYGGAQIQVLDEDTGLPYTVNGQSTFSLPGSPCSRYCLTGGSIQACSK